MKKHLRVLVQCGAIVANLILLVIPAGLLSDCNSVFGVSCKICAGPFAFAFCECDMTKAFLGGIILCMPAAVLAVWLLCSKKLGPRLAGCMVFLWTWWMVGIMAMLVYPGR